MDNYVSSPCPDCGNLVPTDIDGQQWLCKCQKQTRALALPKISKFDRRALHMGADPASIYTVEELEIYERVRAIEKAERADPYQIFSRLTTGNVIVKTPNSLFTCFTQEDFIGVVLLLNAIQHAPRHIKAQEEAASDRKAD